MCIAICLPAGVEIPFDHLVEGQKYNPDGCGLGWVEEGKVQIYKTMSFADFTLKYLDIKERLGNINMLIHFRITSRGVTSEEMCHPFMVKDNMCIIHNGTISNIKADETKNGDSDTKVLAEDILANLPAGWETNASIARLLEDFIGWSKVCILNNKDEMYILNESSGHWLNDIWYSNKSYISYTRTSNVTNLPVKHNSTEYFNSATKSSTSSTDVSRFLNEYCDGCMLEFTYAKLNVHGSDLFCDKCLDKRKKLDEAIIESQQYYSNKPTIMRPCVCCSSLENKEELWHIEVEFPNSILEHPEYVVDFNTTYLKEHTTYADIYSCYSCEECYVKLMTKETGEHVLYVTLLDGPDKYSDDDIKTINSILGGN